MSDYLSRQKERVSDTRGFTLIEMLIAFSLLAVILVALYSSFFLTQRALDGLDSSLVRLQECRMVMDVLRREIDSMVYISGNKYSMFRLEDRDLYGKQTSRLSFTSFSPVLPGLSTLTYYVDENDGKQTLMKKIRSSYTPDTDDKGMECIEDIESFSIEISNNGQWIRTWDASEVNKIPDAVRITITLQLKDRKFTLYETVRPKVGTAL